MKKGRTLVDITGKKFGRLLILERVNKPLYLSNKSRGTYYKVLCDCGAEKIITGGSVKSGDTRSCGCLRAEILGRRNSKDSATWKGGRYLEKNGYVIIRVGKKSRPEHRVVMERILGRPLFSNETIHHKNGIRHDNRPENLELKASRHGRGQTIPDLVAWAKEILEKYGGDSFKS